MKKNIKGFTLIELLAVIVILAIIALIAVPVIMNIISKANESAFKDTAYGVISAGELYFAERQLEPNGMLEDITFNLPDTTKTLQLKGEVPTGQILITKEGKVAIAVYNNRYCVTKGLEDKDVKVTEDIANCKLLDPNSLTALATTSTEITSIPACLNDGTECASGTPVAIKVNASEVYNFYVIDETENEVTLIMDRNIYAAGSTTDVNVAWINADDYALANADDNTSCGTPSCNDEGPITAVAALKERTSGWSNIPEREYTYSDDGGGNRYTAFTETMRARMLTYTEANDVIEANNNTMPKWLYKNLYNTGDVNTFAYWLSSASSRNDVYAPSVTLFGSTDDYDPIADASRIGLRPVITLSK